MKRTTHTKSNNQDKEASEQPWIKVPKSLLTLEAKEIILASGKAKLNIEKLWQKISLENEINLLSFISLIKPALAAIEPARGRSIVVTLGNTGSGKSTVINYLTGANYRLNRQEKIRSHCATLISGIECTSTGHGTMSVTLTPVVCPIEKTDYVLCDLPSLTDTRGREEAICAEIAIQALFNISLDVKAILAVMDINGLYGDRGTSFRNLVKVLESTTNFPAVSDSTYLLITKKDLDYHEPEKSTSGFLGFIRESVLDDEQRVHGTLDVIGSEQRNILRLLDKFSTPDKILIPDIFDNGEARNAIKIILNNTPLMGKNLFTFLQKEGKVIKLLLSLAQQFLNKQKELNDLLTSLDKEKSDGSKNANQMTVYQDEIQRLILELKEGEPAFEIVQKIIIYLELQDSLLIEFTMQFDSYLSADIKITQATSQDTDPRQALITYKSQWLELKKFAFDSKPKVTALMAQIIECYSQIDSWDDCNDFIDHSDMGTKHPEVNYRMRGYLSRQVADSLYQNLHYKQALDYYEKHLVYTEKCDFGTAQVLHIKARFAQFSSQFNAYVCCARIPNPGRSQYHLNSLSKFVNYFASTDDPLNNAKRNLLILGASQNMDLEPNDNLNFIIKMSDGLEITCSFEPHTQRLYISTLLSVIPQDTDIQLNLFQYLLQRNLSGENLLYGGIGVVRKDNMGFVIFHLPIEMAHSNALSLFNVYPTFSQVAKKLRLDCKSILSGEKIQSVSLKIPFPTNWSSFIAELSEQEAQVALPYLKVQPTLAEKQAFEKAKQQLTEFGSADAISLKDLAFDHKNTCKLQIDNAFGLYLTYVEPGYLYLYSQISVPLPENRQMLLKIYDALLQESVVDKNIMGGGVGIKLDEKILIAYTSIDLVHSDMTLSKLMPVFILSIEKQRKLCHDILNNQQINFQSASASSSSSSTVDITATVMASGKPWLGNQPNNTVSQNPDFVFKK